MCKAINMHLLYSVIAMNLTGDHSQGFKERLMIWDETLSKLWHSMFC